MMSRKLTLIFLLAGFLASCATFEDSSYQLRDSYIFEYRQFNTSGFIEPGTVFGTALYIFEDESYYITDLVYPRTLAKQTIDSLVNRSVLEPFEMEIILEQLSNAGFSDWPITLPDGFMISEECEEDANSVRIGYRDDPNRPMSRTTAYMGCPPTDYPDGFNEFHEYMTTRMSIFRSRIPRDVVPDRVDEEPEEEEEISDAEETTEDAETETPEEEESDPEEDESGEESPEEDDEDNDENDEDDSGSGDEEDEDSDENDSDDEGETRG